MRLSAEQADASEHRGGHARMVAVAGSGKTETLVHYLAGLLSASKRSPEVLVLMYNKAARVAFDERLRLRLARGLPAPKVKTLHAMGLEILKALAQSGHIQISSFEPMADIVVDLKLKSLFAEHPVTRADAKEEDKIQEWVDLARHFGTIAKSRLEPPRIVFDSICDDATKVPVVQVFEQLESWREEQQLIGFDDMVYDVVNFFKKNPAIAERFGDRYDQILVDEYQDINPVQHQLLKVLAGKRAQVMVIGDPDQTIYEFRGSCPSFITTAFGSDFTESKTYGLTRTFRFGHALALCANHLIHHNQAREPLLTISHSSDLQTRVKLRQTDDHGQTVAGAIARLGAAGKPLKDIAVLARLWSYIRPVELELLLAGIPYSIDGEKSVLRCRELRPLLHLIEIMAGDFSARTKREKTEALLDLMRCPAVRIKQVQLRKVASIWCENLDRLGLVGGLIAALQSGLNGFQQGQLRELADGLRKIETAAPLGKRLSAYVAAVNYQGRLERDALTQESGKEQARVVRAFIAFTEKISLTRDPIEVRDVIVRMQQQAGQSRSDGVALSTFHRAKGLEWDSVFIPNVCEGHAPYLAQKGASFSLGDIQSERRLMYVAITRAKRNLFLTAPCETDEDSTPSRFIEEMQIGQSIDLARLIDQGADPGGAARSPIACEYTKAIGRILADR